MPQVILVQICPQGFNVSEVILAPVLCQVVDTAVGTIGSHCAMIGPPSPLSQKI